MFRKCEEAVQKMLDTNLLLFVIPKATNNSLIVTGKIFEYLATKNPLLPIGPIDGNAAEILNELHRESMIDYEAADLIKSALWKHYSSWKSNHKRTIRIESDSHTKYTREELTRELERLLLNMLS